VRKVKDVFLGCQTSFIVDEDNKLLACGYNKGYLGIGNKLKYITEYSYVDFPILSKNYIVTAGDCCFYVYDNYQLYACGANDDGRLGGKNDKHKLKKMELGEISGTLIGL
jgi:alpha-tubulin suppressor-like RCC1 family protein